VDTELTDEQIKPLIPQDMDWKHVVSESGAIEFARALFWQLRAKILKLPRYSFLSPQGGGVVRVPDSCGRWIEVYDAAGLCEVEEIDAMLAAAPCAGCGETCKRAKLCATCAGEIAASTKPQDQGVADEMDAIASQYAHKLALDLECVLADYSGKWWDAAIKTLGAYREAMNAIHERESPTFMGEPQPAAQQEPAPTSVSRSKRAQLEAHGYVVNGVAMMHLETRRRVLLDYCGFVGWWHGQVHHDQHAQPERKPDYWLQPDGRVLGSRMDEGHAKGTLIALYLQPEPNPDAETVSLIKACRAAFAEELAAYDDIDPPIHHVKKGHDGCAAWLANRGIKDAP